MKLALNTIYCVFNNIKMSNMKKLIIFCLSTLIILGGCSSKPSAPTVIKSQYETPEQRIIELSQLNRWTVTGKLAFIQPKKRQSAALFWHYDQKHKKQELKLTTFLGFNILSLASKNNVHTVKLDGKTYQHQDLDYLIYSLTNISIPAKALKLWIKGLAFTANDQVIYDKVTHLPKSLTSNYSGTSWTITYGDYQNYNGYQLANNITVKKDALTIKIKINKWMFR